MNPSLSLSADEKTLTFVNAAGTPTLISLDTANGAKVTLVEPGTLHAEAATSNGAGTMRIHPRDAQTTWSIAFDPTNATVDLIGSTDMDGYLRTDTNSFNLVGKELYIRYQSNALITTFG